MVHLTAPDISQSPNSHTTKAATEQVRLHDQRSVRKSLDFNGPSVAVFCAGRKRVLFGIGMRFDWTVVFRNLDLLVEGLQISLAAAGLSLVLSLEIGRAHV